MIRGDKIIPLGIPTNVAIIGLRLITRCRVPRTAAQGLTLHPQGKPGRFSNEAPMRMTFVGVDVARAQIERNES
jgi:hypothetical protein